MPGRKRARIEGEHPHGESKWLAPMLSAAGAAGATALGFAQFAPVAAYAGGYLGQKFKDITGYGAYTVRKNSLMAGDVPNVGNPATTENGMTISHKEFIGDVITGSTANTFTYTSYDITPTNAQLWEWLSQISVNFDEWKPEGIIFFFKSTSGSALNSVNTALGQVIMSTNYNPYNTPFSTKAEMESYEFTTSGDPSQDLIHAIECDPSQGSISTYYSNAGPASGFVQDKRFNTLGTFYIATNGFQGTSVNIGELWVSYQFTFLKSKLYSSLGMANDFLFFQTENNMAAGSSPFGNVGAVTTRNTAFPFSGFTYSATQAWLGPVSSTRVVFHFPVYAFKTTYRVSMNVKQTIDEK